MPDDIDIVQGPPHAPANLYRRPVPGSPNLISRMGSGKLGATTNGAVGGGLTSTMMVLAQEPAALLAREMGCTNEQAMKFMMCFGRIAQQMLLTGKPVGMPHLGLLALYSRTAGITKRTILAQAIRSGKCKSESALGELERLGDTIDHINEVRFVAPRSMHRFFVDNAIYNGHWRLHFVEACKGHKHVTRAKANNKYRVASAGTPDVR